MQIPRLRSPITWNNGSPHKLSSHRFFHFKTEDIHLQIPANTYGLDSFLSIHTYQSELQDQISLIGI